MTKLQETILEKFTTNPAYLNMGAGKLALRFKSTKNDIYKAKEAYKLANPKANKKAVNNQPLKKVISAKSPARVLVYDIETSPMVGYFWTKYPNEINEDFIIQDWKLLTFSAKWLFEDEIISHRLTKKELAVMDDKRLTQELWKMLDSADIVIAHNGKGFDNKKANSKFLEHDLVPPSPYETIDTLLHARRQFKECSNRLDWLGKKFGAGGKIPATGLWTKVMANDFQALKDMDLYCQNDVLKLEAVYLKMRAFIQPHPNMGLHITHDIKACPTCGSGNLELLPKTYNTTMNTYEAFRCSDCGALSRNKKSSLPTDQSKRIMSSVPTR